MVVIDIKAIRDILEDFGVEKISLKGGNLMMCCPFHPDRNPSFGVHPERGANCLSCSASFHNIEDLLETLSKEKGIEYDRDTLLNFDEDNLEREPRPLNPKIIAMYEKKNVYFEENWGIITEIIENRNLRIDPHTGVECFPIWDREDNFWGFVERTPPTENKRSFYKYPKDFKKAEVLLGEESSSRDKFNEVWLVEGIRDLCAVESKVDGSFAVALGGSKPSKKQLQLLLDYDIIVVALDNDDSGRGGVQNVIDNLPSDSIMIARYEGKDPQQATEFELIPPIDMELLD